MNNVTLKAFSVSNFRSFKDEMRFTTEIDYSKKEFLQKNTFDIKDNTYNKVSYILGANAAGKSNICRAIEELQGIIELTPKLVFNKGYSIHFNNYAVANTKINDYFKFEDGYENVPTTFTIEVIIDGTLYLYSFKTLNEIIIEEKLYKKNKRTELILNRTSPSLVDVEVKSDLAKVRHDLDYIGDYVGLHIQEKVLFLPLIAKSFNPLAENILEAILSMEIIEMQKIKTPREFTEKSYNDERMKKYLEIIKLQEPTLKTIDIIKLDDDADDDEDNIKAEVCSAKFRAIYNVYKNNEIIGKRKFLVTRGMSKTLWGLLSVLPSIFNALEYGGVIIIDEVECGLHPNLAKTIVDLFYDEEINVGNGQLICITHNPVLIEKEIRRDQVWLVHKEDHGESVLTRLSDKKVRPNENYAQKYLQGIFGAVPETFIK